MVGMNAWQAIHPAGPEIAAGQPRLAPPVDDGGVHRRVRKEVTEHLQDDFGATVLVEPVMN